MTVDMSTRNVLDMAPVRRARPVKPTRTPWQEVPPVTCLARYCDAEPVWPATHWQAPIWCQPHADERNQRIDRHLDQLEARLAAEPLIDKLRRSRCLTNYGQRTGYSNR